MFGKAKHPKVEAIKAERKAKIDALHQNGRPIFAPDIMREKTAAIDAQYDTLLVTLMETAQLQHDAAAETLAEVDAPYEWLTKDELTHAATLAPFVKEDIEALDAAQLVDAVKTAVGRGRVEKWLTWRYANRRAGVLDTEQETALNMSQRAHFNKDISTLRDSVMLPSQLKERQTAEKELKDAQTLHDAAEWARPSVRQETAARWGVQAEYLPD